MIRFYTLSFLSLLFFASCKTASKAYEQGDYANAVEIAVKKLQKDQADRDLKALLQQSYKFAVERHEDKIRILSNSSSDRKWEEMLSEYNSLQRLYNLVRQYPSANSTVHPTDYSSFIETYRGKAADVHYEMGLKWLDEETKNGYREAYHEFSRALRFKPDDFEIKKQMQQAYEAALVRVVLLPIDAYNNNYYYSNGSYQMRNFQDQIIRNLNFQTNNSFVKFYSTLDARSSEFKPDEVLEMRMGRLSIGQPIDQQHSRQVSKEVVTKEIVYKKDSVVKEYTKVYATITTVKRTLVSEGDMFVTSRDERGRILWSDNFVGEHRWHTEFATYTGDERALSDNDKALINRRPSNLRTNSGCFKAQANAVNAP
jgi:hypothetical protein